MKITLAQLNPVVGDIEGNLAKLENTFERFCDESDLIVYPELFLVGYPPRDLLERPSFIKRVEAAMDGIKRLSRRESGCGILFGAPTRTGSPSGKGLYNSAVLMLGGKTVYACHKSLLPTYDVFDEARYFDEGGGARTVRYMGSSLGISVCEDMWFDSAFRGKGDYRADPVRELIKKKAGILINISASPFYAGKEAERLGIIKGHAAKAGAPFIFVNQVGGNDELIFDGRSAAVTARGRAARVLAGFREDVVTVDTSASAAPGRYVPQDEVDAVYDALVLGVKDYVRKTGFTKCVVGLSGGIDSSVVAAIAAGALGPRNVVGVSMPSEYTASKSMTLAGRLAKNLGIEFKVIPVSGIYRLYLKELKGHTGRSADVGITEQNIQARIRGNILMALSNRFGYLLLSTGNKSELATGYCTLYGDMSGGLAVISDVPKTLVYRLADRINARNAVIPRGVITRPPSAELKPGQKDRDTLPPYDVLDGILGCYIDDRLSPEEIIKRGFKPEIVRWVVNAVAKSEYKRKQAAPGLKVTTKSFGIGRRIPIAARHEY